MGIVVAGSPVVTADLDTYCRDALAGFKVPRRYEFVESLPRNAAGKILKRESAAQERRAEPGERRGK